MGHVDGDLAFNPRSDDGAGGNDLPPRPQADFRKGPPGKVGASGVDPERGEDLDERVVGDCLEVAVVPPAPRRARTAGNGLARCRSWFLLRCSTIGADPLGNPLRRQLGKVRATRKQVCQNMQSVAEFS